MSCGFLTIDVRGIILTCNSPAASLFGYETEELRNHSLYAFLPELAVLSVREMPRSQSFLVKGIHRQGESFLAHIELSPFQLDDRTYFTVLIQKVTDSRSGINTDSHIVELRLTERFLQTFMEHSADAVVVANHAHKIFGVNQAFRQFYQWAPEEIPHSLSFFLPENLHDEWNDLFHTISSGGRVDAYPTIHKRTDGSLFDACVTIFPLDNSPGLPAQYVIVTRDISEQKKHDEELRMTKEYLESFISNTADAIGIFDLAGNLVRVNQASEEIFGWSPEEQLGKPVQTIPSPDYLDEVKHLHARVRAGECIRGYETTRMRKDGKLIHVSITYSPIRDSNGNVIAFANILRDITESKRVEKALRESEAKYRLIAENMSDMIQLMNKDGIITYASPSHLQIIGFPSSHFEGSKAYSLIHPDDLEKVKPIFHNMTRTKQPSSFDLRFLHQSGNWIDLEVRCIPILDSEGLIETFISVARDVTERKQTEELLRNSDKLSIIGQLAAGIAHEIRNPLTSLRGFIQLMKEADSGFSFYNIMISELDRINFIASELLLLAKPQAVNYKETEITLLVEDVIRLLDAQAILNNVQIVTRYQNNLPNITCEENQLKQVFINVLKNALEAMPAGGTIQVEVSSPDEEHIQLRFIDEGCGIPEDRLPKLGEPFYTTKEKGTGLGLMVSYKIIRNHHGSISIFSSLQVGTTVEIKLPLLTKDRLL